MKLVLRFFDKESWSYYAIIVVIIPIILLLLLTKKLDVQDMIFLSLLGMMEGDLFPKIIMTGFLNFLVFKPTTEWIQRSVIYVVSIVLMNEVKMNNVVHRMIMKSEELQLIIKIVVTIWMSYILYSIMSELLNRWRNV